MSRSAKPLAEYLAAAEVDWRFVADGAADGSLTAEQCDEAAKTLVNAAMKLKREAVLLREKETT